MDSLTHIVLGACIGEAIAGKYMDKRAMWYGALAQSIPDVDFVTAFYLHGAENVVAHRGITHSILFGIAATFFLTWLVKNVIHKTPLPWKNVWLLFAVNIFAHLLIDTFNAYGVALLSPFSGYRYTFNVLYVADPLFSIAPFVAFLFLLFLNKSHRRRVAWIQTGILVSAIYLCIAIFNKQVVNTEVRESLVQQGKPAQFFTTPSPFNSLLWFVVAKDSAGYHTAYRSVFDSGPVAFTYFPRNDQIGGSTTNQKDLRLLKDFAQGYYTLETMEWYNPRGILPFIIILIIPTTMTWWYNVAVLSTGTGKARQPFFERCWAKEQTHRQTDEQGTRNGEG